jgi:hypothetical protein
MRLIEHSIDAMFRRPPASPAPLGPIHYSLRYRGWRFWEMGSPTSFMFQSLCVSPCWVIECITCWKLFVIQSYHKTSPPQPYAAMYQCASTCLCTYVRRRDLGGREGRVTNGSPALLLNSTLNSAGMLDTLRLGGTPYAIDQGSTASAN